MTALNEQIKQLPQDRPLTVEERTQELYQEAKTYQNRIKQFRASQSGQLLTAYESATQLVTDLEYRDVQYSKLRIASDRQKEARDALINHLIALENQG